MIIAFNRMHTICVVFQCPEFYDVPRVSIAEARYLFSKVPQLFGPILGATIAFITSQRQGFKPSNFAILLVFLLLKTCKKISFSKQADCSLTTNFSGLKSSRDFPETGPRSFLALRAILE